MTPTIGASSVAAILGLSPWQRPIDVWTALSGEGGYDEADRGPLLRGQLLDPANTQGTRGRLLRQALNGLRPMSKGGVNA